MSLKDAVTKLPQIGSHYGQILKKPISIQSKIFLFYLPYRYLDFFGEKIHRRNKDWGNSNRQRSNRNGPKYLDPESKNNSKHFSQR